MSIRCPHCSQPDWTRAPDLKAAWDWAKGRREVTTAELRDALGGSTQNANNKVRALAGMGLLRLDRRETHPTGGKFGVYVPTPEHERHP